MCAKTIQILAVLVSLFTLGLPGAFGQGVFSVGAETQMAAADIGYTELAGRINLTVSSGTTVAAPLQITYSAPITNNAESDISVVGSGFPTAVSMRLVKSVNSIIINVPAGASAGSQIVISGVRVAIAGLGLSKVSASISSPTGTGNFFVGLTNPVVIAAVSEPFSIDQTVAAPLSYSRSAATNSNTYFDIAEKYPNAFTGNTGLGGQTVATRILIKPLGSIVDGIKITFPASIASGETGATFTTLSGVDEVIPREDGSTDVTYEFSAGAGSSFVIESFRFRASMTVDSTTGSGSIPFQAELIPIGLATPDDQFPSTDIPRYVERFLPNPESLSSVTGSTELVVPFRIQSENTYTGIALSNTQNARVTATLTAYNAGGIIFGNGISNPVSISIEPNTQYFAVAKDIFGPSFNASSAGVIRIVANSSDLKGMYLTGDLSGPKLDGGLGDLQPVAQWYLPVLFRQGRSPFNSLEVYNPENSEATLNLKLMDATGSQKGDTQTIKVSAGSPALMDLRQLFGAVFDSLSGGYVKGSSDSPLVVRDNFGSALESNLVAAQWGSLPTSFSVPFFATGGPYATELSLVNTSISYYNQPAEIIFTLLNANGQPIVDPVTIAIDPGAQTTRTVAGLFPSLGSNVVTGSIKVDIKTQNLLWLATTPSLVGVIRYSNNDGSGSTTVPLYLAPSTNAIYSHVAENSGYFTGLAVVNPGTAAASFTLSVYGRDGKLTGTKQDTLQPGASFSQVLDQLVPASFGQLGGYFTLSSDNPLTSFGVFATTDLKSMSAIPAQEIQ